MLFVCTAPTTKQSEFVQKILAVQGVIDVREMLVGKWNIYVEVVGTSTEEITRITDTLHESGITIESSEIMRERHLQPFDHFHFSEAVADEQRES